MKGKIGDILDRDGIVAGFILDLPGDRGPLNVYIDNAVIFDEYGLPIPAEDLGYDDRETLRDQTFEAVRELRTRARSRVRELGVDPGGID